MAKQYRQQMAKNTMWNALEHFSLIGIQLLCTFALARFLTPSDFGIVGTLVIFTAIAQTIVKSGFGIAIIREKNVTDLDLSSVFYLNIGISFILYVILFFGSPLIARFYHEPILNDICKVTFLVVPVFAFQLVQTALCHRNLQFKKLAVISFISSVSSSVIAVIIAYHIRNVWALVFQNLLTYVFRGLLLWFTTKWYPIFKFSWTSINKFFGFSKNLLLTGLVQKVFENINALLIGHYYTTSDLGFYSQANRINNVASHQMTDVVKSVSYPILAKVNNNDCNVKEGYRKVIMVTIIFVGCLVALLAGISRDLMELLMGSAEWRVAGNYLLILGVTGALYPLHAINQNILNVKGQSKTLLKLEVTRRLVLVAILAITVHFNVIIFACGYAFYSFILVFLNLYVCGKPINYSLSEQLKDIIPIYSRQIAMVSIAIICNMIFTDSHIVFRMTISLLSSIIGGIALFWNYPQVKEIVVLYKKKKE